MLERLTNAPYWRAMVQASSRAWRQRQSATPWGHLYGWEVWCMDGKVFLFKGNAVRRADWFEFCWAVRRWVGGGMIGVLSGRKA